MNVRFTVRLKVVWLDILKTLLLRWIGGSLHVGPSTARKPLAGDDDPGPHRVLDHLRRHGRFARGRVPFS